jgi:MFS transporter, AAHS family, 4-hydroxybenzoate transporter
VARSREEKVLVALCLSVPIGDGMEVAIMGFVAPTILPDWNISPRRRLA